MRGEGDELETSGDVSRYHSRPMPPPKSPNFHQPRWHRQGGGGGGYSGKSADGALILLPKPPIYITCTIYTPAIIEQLLSTSQLNLPIGS